MIMKLSFTDKDQWDAVKTSFLLADEQGNYGSGTFTNNGMTIREVGHIPIPATYDENGEILTEASAHTDYAVDVLSANAITELNGYILKSVKSNYYHGFSGNNDEVVLPTPDSSWLKADIQEWLTANNIEYTSTMTKTQLLNLI